MDLEILREFLTLSEKLNFSATAKQHFMAQSVLSRHIAELEKSLGVALFYRNHQIVYLTEYGRLFLPHAQRIISEYDSALQKMEAEKMRLSSSLHIAYIFDVMGNRMGKIFDSFLSICPDVELSYDLIDAVTPTGVFMELHPDTDIVINYLCEPLLEERYCTQELYTEPLCLIVKKDHPLAEKDAIFLREIQQESLIECAPTQHGFYRTQLRAALKDAGSSFIHSRDAKSLKQTLVMIESGLGSTIAPWRYGRYNFPNLKAIPIEDDSSQIPVAAIWRKDNLNPNIGKIIKIIERELKEESFAESP